MWVDLGLVNLVSAIMDGPTTLYEMPEGSFLSQIRFTDDPDNVMTDFLESDSGMPFFTETAGYIWIAAGTVKSFGWSGFAGLGATAAGQEGIPGKSYDTLMLAATAYRNVQAGTLGLQDGIGYGPFAANGDAGNDSNAVVLSAASVGPIQIGLIFGTDGKSGNGVRVAAITAWAPTTHYDSPNDNFNAPVPTPGVLQKCVIVENGTLWFNGNAGGTSGGSAPDFAGNAGGSVGDGPAVAATTVGESLPTLPLTIVVATNDEFVFTGDGGGGTPETFTIAPGTYSTMATLLAAIGAAHGSVSDEAFSTVVTPSNADGYVFLTAVTAGTASNDNTITPGEHDASAALGLANPTYFEGGLDHVIEWFDTTSPPPTVGAVHVFAEIIMPVVSASPGSIYAKVEKRGSVTAYVKAKGTIVAGVEE